MPSVISICILAACFLHVHAKSLRDATPEDCGVVVDAGSSGSRVYVYCWPALSHKDEVPQAREVHQLKIKPGISTFSGDTSGVPDYIGKLLNEAKANVPLGKQALTPFYVMATAGMRVLPEGSANDIINAINDVLLNKDENPFQYEPANTRILSGEEEGAFSWITVNYLRGLFTDDSSVEPAGVLEMGGASTQITFIPDGSLLADKFPVVVGGEEYPLYVHSYLNYGQELALDWGYKYMAKKHPGQTAINHPCVLIGDVKHAIINGLQYTFDGTSSPVECKVMLDEYVYQVDSSMCNPEPCAIGPFYQPPIPVEKDYYATSAFVYEAEELGITIKADGTVTPNELIKASLNYCLMDFRKAKEWSGNPDQYISSTCQMGVYESVLLTKAYGFARDTQHIKVVNSIHENELTWTLGALIYEISKLDFPCDAE